MFGVIPLREEHKLFNLYKTFALTRTTPVGGFIQYNLANEISLFRLTGKRTRVYLTILESSATRLMCIGAHLLFPFFPKIGIHAFLLYTTPMRRR